MATIALYADKINRMPGLINGIKKSVVDYRSELAAIKAKSLTVNRSVCDLEEVLDAVRTSSDIQDEKIESLDALNHDIEEFVAETVRIDREVAALIRQRRAEFYDEYPYLKPDCEKSGWEKLKDGCKKIGEWCKEHWKVAVTVVVVIAVAAAAVLTFGVALVAVAAIAGILSLALCIADVICMVKTGGKDISDVFREKGWNTLADIFKGLSVGCDIVSIVFPVGAILKSMAKIGFKTFVKTTFQALKRAFQEAGRKVFKSGWKEGLKNAIKIPVKTLIKTFFFDIDDFSKLHNGKRVWSLMAKKTPALRTNNVFEEIGGSLVPKEGVVPKGGSGNCRNNKGQTLDKILKDYGLDSIPLTRSGDVDWAKLSVVEPVKIDMKNMEFDIDEVLSGKISSKEFSDTIRDANFAQARAGLPNGMIHEKELAKSLGYGVTIHEDFSTKMCYFVPTELHANINHNGKVGNYKATFYNVPKLSDLLSRELLQKRVQFGGETWAAFVTGN